MPTRKSAPRWHELLPVEARPSTVEEAEALAAVPPATAVEVPSVPCIQIHEPGSRKKARIHEVFKADPTDTSLSANA